MRARALSCRNCVTLSTTLCPGIKCLPSSFLSSLPFHLAALQVIQAVLKDTSDTTQLRLLYANVSPDDILLRDELDALAAAHPNFSVWYTGELCSKGGVR